MSNRMKLRTAPTLRLNQDMRIDRANNAIRDVVAMQAGIEATGHGCQADLKTLQMMEQLGNARARGVKQHFGHIGMSENAMGKQIATARRYRVDGDKLRHDIELLPAARISPVFARDPLEFIYTMAEDHPADFGESVVIDAETVWTLSDGREIPEWSFGGSEVEGVTWDENRRPVNALTPLPVLRPTFFMYCDIVADGALTHDGLFGAEALGHMFAGTSSAYAQQVFDLVDEWRDEYNIPLDDVPRKVNQVVSKYLLARGYQEGTNMASKKKLDTNGVAPAQVVAEVIEDEVTQEEAPADPLDTALTQADETTERLDEPASEPDVETAEAEPAAQSLAAAMDRIVALEAVVQRQSETIEKLTRLSVQNTANIDLLDRNIRRVAADPVTTMSVPRTRPASLDALVGSDVGPLEAPKPPKGLNLNSRPVHVTQRAASGTGDPEALDFDGDPEMSTLLANIARQKALGVGN